jgi:hypothetical protein
MALTKPFVPFLRPSSELVKQEPNQISMSASLNQLRLYVLISLLVFVQPFAQAQVSGLVKDASSGKLLNGVDIFINNTSLSTKSNSNGEFTLTGIAPGFAELSLYKEGYQIFKNSLRIQLDKAYKLNLTLTPLGEVPKPVKVKQDEEWKKNEQWFERGFFGTTSNATECKIVNVKALTFTRTGDVLTASASEPVVVDNSAIGYRIYYYLQGFEAGVESGNAKGLVRFDTLSPKDDKVRELWDRNRLKSFWGSDRHLFKSLVDHNAAEQGFELSDENGSLINLDSIVVPGKIAGYQRINLKSKTRVKYLFDETSEGARKMDKDGQISWIIPGESIEASVDGILFNPRSVEITGQMSQGKLAELLPLNYVATSSLESEKMDWQNFALLQEKVYLHTDRDYYYPKENVWFKAYMGYSMPALRDTLSKVLYVDLIGADKKIMKTKSYKIGQGVTWGDFKLPDSLVAGQYYLRAYTNWMRNYGENTFFTKAIPVLSFDQNLDPDQQPKVSEAVTSPVRVAIQPSKSSFGKREEVTLTFAVQESTGQPINGNLSVSVTDAFSTLPVAGQRTIVSKDVLATNEIEKTTKYFEKIEHFMERGLSFKGRVKDDKGNPTAANLSVVQGKLENLITMETDEKGEFVLTGLDFIDSTSFSFKPTNKKGKVYPTVEIVPKEIPIVKIDTKPLDLKLRKEDALQRIQNTYTPEDNVVLLDNVEIKASRINDEVKKGPARVYGEPDYSVRGDQMRSTTAGSNLLVGLQGKVPGLQVLETTDANGVRSVSVRVRGGSSSLAGNTEPLILVDGVPFPDPNSLIGISPESIDRIEVVTRAVPQFGSRGSNGLIAIFLKTGNYAGNDAGSQKDVIVHKIIGYNKPRKFFSPDYSGKGGDSNPDFRTTVCWEPNVIVGRDGKASVSFYTADLETRYRIVIEGVSENGIPFRTESFIDVK